MKVILRLASSVDDVLALILGEEFPTPADQVMAQYPYLFID